MEPRIRPGMPNPVWWVAGLIALVLLLWVLFAWTPERAIAEGTWREAGIFAFATGASPL